MEWSKQEEDVLTGFDLGGSGRDHVAQLVSNAREGGPEGGGDISDNKIGITPHALNGSQTWTRNQAKSHDLTLEHRTGRRNHRRKVC